MPYETPSGGVYDSGDFPRALDMALEMIGYDTLEQRRAEAKARGKLSASASARPLDSGTNNFAQSRYINPEAAVLGQQRGRDGQARHVRRDRRDARDDAAGAGTRDVGRTGRRRAARLLAGHRQRARRPRHVLELELGLLGHLREPVRRLRPVGRARRGDEARRADEGAGRHGARRCRSRRHRARRRLRAHPREPRGRPPVHGARRDHQRQQRRLPGRLRPDDERTPRLPAAVPAARLRPQVRQPHAHLRDADPRGSRSRSTRRRGSTSSSTTRSSTTAATASTPPSSRAR